MKPFYRKLLIPAVVLVFASLIGGYQLYWLPKTQMEQTEKVWVKNGNSYRTTVTYESPGGQEVNQFLITLEGGVIKNVEVEVLTEIAASIRYQKQFAQEMPKLLIGKKLSEVGAIDKVSGASLTTNAFNDALLKLKQEVRS